MIASIFALSLLQGADAAVWGEVDAIWAPDASGTWRRTDRSGGALLLEGTEESVLEVGQELEEGAQLRTTQARVRIRLRKRGQVVVRPESEVRLEQRPQRAGIWRVSLLTQREGCDAIHPVVRP